MLTLTENATTIISSITQQEGAPEGMALRITSESPDQGLAVTTTTEADAADQVVEQSGTTVYLDEGAASMLDDKILDASVTADGQVEFAIGQQG